MAMLVSFLDKMRAGLTSIQLWPHLVRLPVLEGEKMLSSPPQGMLSSLHMNKCCMFDTDVHVEATTHITCNEEKH